MTTLFVGTQNPGKILEYKALLGSLGVKMMTPRDYGITESPPEDADTFEENARAKAEFYTKRVAPPLISEDSGLEVEALGGASGVHSRRWLGRESTDEELVTKLLDQLNGKSGEERKAQLRVVMVFIPCANQSVVAEGILEGYIMEKPEADIVPGYPFRSVFYVPKIGKVLGALTMEEEAHIAHRREALNKLLPYIRVALNLDS